MLDKKDLLRDNGNYSIESYIVDLGETFLDPTSFDSQNTKSNIGEAKK